MTTQVAKCSVLRQSGHGHVAQCDSQRETAFKPIQVLIAYMDNISDTGHGTLFAVDLPAAMSCSIHIVGYTQQKAGEGHTGESVQS